MPSLGADMEAGTLVRWLVHPGDTVARGDLVAVVQTEKADVEIEVFTAGVIEEIRVKEGEKVPVGTVLAIVRAPGEEAAPPAAPLAAAPPAAPPPPAPGPQPVRLPASPAARRRAEELGLDLSRVRGTGPEGSVTLRDVEEASGATAAAERPADRQARMRAAIAATMARSNREIPHYYLETRVDVGRALEWMAQENLRRPVERRLLAPALLLKAVALSLKKVPELNGFWVDNRFRPAEAIHLGVAISLRGGGLVAPAVHAADTRTLDELMADLRDLVNRARSGSLRSSEVSDPTITVTNLGDLGVDAVFGVIFPPQVALVGIGRIREAAGVLEGAVVPRPTVAVTLAADHRASDGHRGGLFLASVDELLQSPEKL